LWWGWEDGLAAGGWAAVVGRCCVLLGPVLGWADVRGCRGGVCLAWLSCAVAGAGGVRLCGWAVLRLCWGWQGWLK